MDCDTLNNVDRKKWENTTLVFRKCDPENDIDFKYGIFENAITKSVISLEFLKKYFYCLWWGLQNLRYEDYMDFYYMHFHFTG